MYRKFLTLSIFIFSLIPSVFSIRIGSQSDSMQTNNNDNLSFGQKVKQKSSQITSGTVSAQIHNNNKRRMHNFKNKANKKLENLGNKIEKFVDKCKDKSHIAGKKIKNKTNRTKEKLKQKKNQINSDHVVIQITSGTIGAQINSDTEGIQISNKVKNKKNMKQVNDHKQI